MKAMRIDDPTTPILGLLKQASQGPVIISLDGHPPFALVQLDDDILDLLLERNPDFQRDCASISARMAAGEAVRHAEVKASLGFSSSP